MCKGYFLEKHFSKEYYGRVRSLESQTNPLYFCRIRLEQLLNTENLTVYIVCSGSPTFNKGFTQFKTWGKWIYCLKGTDLCPWREELPLHRVTCHLMDSQMQCQQLITKAVEVETHYLVHSYRTSPWPYNQTMFSTLPCNQTQPLTSSGQQNVGDRTLIGSTKSDKKKK